MSRDARRDVQNGLKLGTSFPRYLHQEHPTRVRSVRLSRDGDDEDVVFCSSSSLNRVPALMCSMLLWCPRSGEDGDEGLSDA
mmetsp:Transcript_21284/g.87024  ORF Transcript_21284/g.87024 Transcript_21284/m.87024 type:complete len:82 (-) Transcript_21284:1159-1404(-)